MTCEKCGDRGTYEWAERVKLIGEYSTRLCTRCENAWRLFALAHPLWTERCQIDDRIRDMQAEFERTKEMPFDAQMIQQRLRAMDREWFALAEAWVHERSASATKTNAVGQPTESPI